MKDRRNRVGVTLFNLALMLALFMPGGISASSTQPANQKVNSIQDVTLAPDDSISGRVTDSSGAPLAGITMQATDVSRPIVVLVHGWQGMTPNWNYSCATGITRYDPENKQPPIISVTTEITACPNGCTTPGLISIQPIWIAAQVTPLALSITLNVCAGKLTRSVIWIPTTKLS